MNGGSGVYMQTGGLNKCRVTRGAKLSPRRVAQKSRETRESPCQAPKVSSLINIALIRKCPLMPSNGATDEILRVITDRTEIRIGGAKEIYFSSS